MPHNWLRFRVPLGFLLAGVYLSLARPASASILSASAMLVALGCLLRSWAAGYLFKGKRVAVGGPYAYIRNPLYAGSFIIGAGFCLALWRWPPPWSAVAITLVFVAGFGVIYPAKVRAEENELAGYLGDAYRRYAQRVPAYWPVRGRVHALGEQRFSRELYRRNREYQCVIGSAAMLLCLIWRYRLYAS